MKNKHLDSNRLSARLFLVRVVALLVFLTLVGLQLFVLFYQNPAFSIGLRVVTIAVLFGLAYLGGVVHGSIERTLTKNSPKTIEEDHII